MKIYHNPRCGKSRAALKYLLDNGFKPEVIEYLKTPPTLNELKEILSKANLKAFDLIRTKEDVYISVYKGKTLTEDQWIEAMIKNPILMERPIIVKADNVIIGRTEENLQELLKT